MMKCARWTLLAGGLLVGNISSLLSAKDASTAPSATSERSVLEAQFLDPPASVRPRTWWHWLNGNVTLDGAVKDLAWMKRVGLGGVQTFDASLPAPQIVDKRLVYMAPEWAKLFREVAKEADRLDLELGISTSPGWSETGGPWVKPEDGMKKLVWSEILIDGGRRFQHRLPAPPAVTGPFQSQLKGGDVNDMMWGKNAPKRPAPPVHYADVAVLAVPGGDLVQRPEKAVLQDGGAIRTDLFQGTDLESSVDIPRGSAKSPSAVILQYARKQTIRSATLFIGNAKALYMPPSLAPVLEASDDGVHWRAIVEFPVEGIPTTVSFAPVTAQYFRLLLTAAKPGMVEFGAPAPGAEMPGDAGDFMKGLSAPWQLRQFTLSPDARVDQFEAKAGYSIALDYFALPERADGAMGADPSRVIDLTGRVNRDGVLDWSPPPGKWRIIRFGYSLTGTTNHPAVPEATGLEVDKFDASAVRRHMEHYLGTYQEAVGRDLIGERGIRALVSDSIEAGPSNWTGNMVAQFKRLRGYDPLPWLPTLAGALVGSREQSDKFLFDYRRTLADLTASEHYGTVASVAHENGLKLYGEALESWRPSLGDDMAMRRHTDVPMAAMWTFARGQRPNPTYVADIRGAASVAHIYGQNIVAAESMTSAMNYWNDSPATLKRVIDVEFVNGVNLPVIHTSPHSPNDDKLPGLSLSYFGQFFNRHETWGEMARPWIDYIARHSLMLQQGVNVADLAYFYGEEGPLTGLYGNVPISDAPRNYAFDFVNAEILAGALQNDGDVLVTAGGARYRALFLGGSSNRMSLATLRQIVGLVEGGATVIGKAPQGDPGAVSDAAEYASLLSRLWPNGSAATQIGKGRVIATQDAEAALTSMGVAPQFRFIGATDADIPFVHRKLPDGDSFFLVNRKDRDEPGNAHFRVTGKVPELWHSETGRAEPVSYTIRGGETIIPLSLGAEESVHVVFRKVAKVDARTIAPPSLESVQQLQGWKVAFQPGRGAPASATLERLAPLNELSDPGIRFFSGVATYSRGFTPPKSWTPGRPLWLDLGKVGELAEIRVNGRLAGAAWHHPFRVNIAESVRKGRNIIEVRVANLWVNRLIGDAQPDGSKFTFTALRTYRPGAPLRPSGLIGPVQVLIERPK